MPADLDLLSNGVEDGGANSYRCAVRLRRRSQSFVAAQLHARRSCTPYVSPKAHATVRNDKTVARIGPPNATWRDVKQLGWAALLLVPYIAVVCVGAARLVGWRAAFWLGSGLVALPVVTFVLLIALSLVVTYGDDAVQSRLHVRRQ
jgi:hypothetical protein